jgi:AcrR family transcriptional regulator
VIDLDELLDVVEGLFATGGLEAVSIERAAVELGVSRATLYRTVPTKEHLLGLLLKRMTDALTDRSLAVVEDKQRSARERLYGLMRVHFESAIQMRDYMFVFFGGQGLQPDDYAAWRRFAVNYEQIWVDAVCAAQQEGMLTVADPVVATRLLLGMIVWVSRWWRPRMGLDADDLLEQAKQLLESWER